MQNKPSIKDFIKQKKDFINLYLNASLTLPMKGIARCLTAKQTNVKDIFGGHISGYTSKYMVEDVLKAKIEKVGDEELYDKRCIIIMPHRTWADFWIHKYIAGFKHATLSRMAVALAFPSWFLVQMDWFDRTIWFFDRGKTQGGGIKAIEEFNKWLDREFENHAQGEDGGLIVYAEGSRNLENSPLPLKKGILHYAFTRKMPVQVVMTHGTENVCREGEWSAFPGEVVKYKPIPVFDPTTYSDDRSGKKKFIADITKAFNESFKEFYDHE